MKTRGAIYIIIEMNRAKAGDYFNDVSLEQNYYTKLAIRSAASLKKHMPDLPITLFTNLNPASLKDSPFDNFLPIPVPEPIEDFWTTKFKCLQVSPYEQVVHFDADTFVCDDFSEVFTSLDKYDVAATMSVSWNTRSFRVVPDSFPELAFGVFWYRKNEQTHRLFDRAIKLLEQRTRGCDEPYVRVALYQSNDVRFYVLPWEYNCLYTHPAYLFGKVKIMHGHTQDVEKDAEIINTKIYENYPPWKRVITGTKIYLYKKIKQKLMVVEKEIEYKGLGNDGARA